MAAKCQAITKSGKPCSATPLPGQAWCAWHAPEWADRRAAWSAKGGANRSHRARAAKDLPADPMSTEQLHAWLGVVFKKVITGTMEPPVATAAANVARTMGDLSKTIAVEEQLADLARQVAVLSGKRSA